MERDHSRGVTAEARAFCRAWSPGRYDESQDQWPATIDSSSECRDSVLTAQEQWHNATRKLGRGGTLMSEVAYAGEDHGHVALVASADDLLVALRTAGLDDARHAGIDQQFRAIVEGEKRI